LVLLKIYEPRLWFGGERWQRLQPPLLATCAGPLPALTNSLNSFSSALNPIGEPVMSDSSRLTVLLVFSVLSALLISPRSGHAQSTNRDTTWAALDVTAALNSAIEESKGAAELREKVVRRFSECSLMYGGLSTLTSNADAKKNYVEAQLATMEIESTIAKPLQSEKRVELEEAARRSVALLLRTVQAHGDKEVGPLVKKCKAINDLKEIKNALRDLSSQ
jgi:hypothetical protein